MPENSQPLRSSLSFPQEGSSRNYHYEFGPYRLATDTRKLFKNGEAIRLTSRVFEVLLALVARRGELVTKEELFRSVWPGFIVEEGNISVAISTIRKILGDSPQKPCYIETVQGYGYIFIAKVETVPIPGKASELRYNLRDNQGQQLKPDNFDCDPALAFNEEDKSIASVFTSGNTIAKKSGRLLFDRRVSLTLTAALVVIIVAIIYTTLQAQALIFIGVISMLSALIGWLWGRTV